MTRSFNHIIVLLMKKFFVSPALALATSAVIFRCFLAVLSLTIVAPIIFAQSESKRGLPIETELSIQRGYPLGNLSPFGLGLVDKYQTPMYVVGADLMYKINDNHSLGIDYWGGSSLTSLGKVLDGADWQNLHFVGLGYAYSIPKEVWLARLSASIGYVRNNHKIKEKESTLNIGANGLGLSLGVSASVNVSKSLSLGLKCSINTLLLGKWSGDSQLIDSNSYYSTIGVKEGNTVFMPTIGIVLMTR